MELAELAPSAAVPIFVVAIEADIPRGRADASQAELTGVAQAAEASTFIGSTLLPRALGKAALPGQVADFGRLAASIWTHHAGANTLAIDAGDIVSGARTANTAAGVVSALPVVALRLAAVFVADAHLAWATAHPVAFHAGARAVSLLAHYIDSLAQSAIVTAPIGATVLAGAQWLADTGSLFTFVASGARPALTTAAVVPAVLVLALRVAIYRFALPGDALFPLSTLSAATSAPV